MILFHISAECYPIVKVGGLADVVGALSKYQTKLGHQTKVVIPCYETPFFQEHKFETQYEGKIQLGLFEFSYSVMKGISNKLDFELCVIAIPDLFDRPQVYGYEDDTERFVAFQIAFLNWLTETNQKPDILHCHDHHTGLIPFMVQNCISYKDLNAIPTVLTIHNGQYQGAFTSDKLNYLPEYDPLKMGLLEWNGMINPLASAIKCAWRITTVSPSYLEELCSTSNGIENLLRYEKQKCIGILNGIDTDEWNPETDPMLPFKYSKDEFIKGKNKNKEFVCEQFNLDISKPLFVFIGRFVEQKSADLLPEICSVVLNRNPKEINILIIGSGDVEIEQRLKSLYLFYNGNFNVHVGYDEKMAHVVYAGADFLLMPSRFEPCGLNQMYALRYGTIPIVKRTGGLRDTVLDIGDGGFGICHEQANVSDVNFSMNRAIELFHDHQKFNSIRSIAMNINHSWYLTIDQYIKVYESLIP